MADAAPTTGKFDCRDAWAKTLCDLARSDPRIVVWLTANWAPPTIRSRISLGCDPCCN